MSGLALESHEVGCPYCGEPAELLVDCSAGEQSYIEDCFVCCRPISVSVTVDHEGVCTVRAAHENEA